MTDDKASTVRSVLTLTRKKRKADLRLLSASYFGKHGVDMQKELSQYDEAVMFPLSKCA
jgi:hypothetical protein